MEKRGVFERIVSEGLIPLIRAGSPEDALAIAGAIKDGGAHLLEVTMTVPGAMDVIKELTREYGDAFVVGAGTVLDPETGRTALSAGAQFVVTPTLNIEVIRMARRYGTVVISGTMTPTEIITAWEAGADLVKVFPAEQLGGPPYIKAVLGPLPQVLLVPSGGVNIGNAGQFIRAGAAAVAAGGELVDKKAVKEKRFAVIEENTRTFLAKIREAQEEK